ncbi:MAG TPA: non-canonical purine NTP pyrophosphatase [archaeon]|nr:non-canonical purine NTP pyrophosphatase [archaeon]
MEIIFATSNHGKALEAAKVLEKFNVKVKHKKMDIIELDLDSIEEISVEKAKSAFKKIKKPLIVEDTGVYLSAFPGFPGVVSKKVMKALRVKGFIKLLKGEKNRKMEFNTVFTFIWGKNKFKVFDSSIHGNVPFKPKGNSHKQLLYDSMFVPEGFSETFAEMTVEEKNKLSARGKALEKLGRWLKNERK